MSYLTRLSRAVKQQIAAGDVGAPVFARLVVGVDADHGLLLPAAAEGVAEVSRLLGAPVNRIFGRGSVQSGHLSVQVQLGKGRSAQVAVVTQHQELPRIDLLVVGNHGTLCHEYNDQALEQSLLAAADEQFFDRTPLGRQLEEAVRGALENAMAVSVSGGAE